MGEAGSDRDAVGAGSVEPAVALSGFSKTFGTARVLADVDLAIAPGELHALIGHNGSGKSTFLKLLSGLYEPDSGEILLDGVRGEEKTPGEFRRSQNWIGGASVATALFVPPTADNMWPALDDWEQYVRQEQPELPVLIRSALLHYQFETIHPFTDGNGRVGRRQGRRAAALHRPQPRAHRRQQAARARRGHRVLRP